MPIEVEVNVRVPSLTIQTPDGPDRRIDNSSVRFTKRIAMESLPKPGDRVPLTTRFGEAFEGTVISAEWSDRKDLFVVACKHLGRSITVDALEALQTDPDWTTQHLP